jgi:TonB family protein
MYRCSFPGCPVPVSIHISLIETLQRIVRNESGDRQGIIYGQPSAAGTVVESSRALTVFGMEEMRGAIAEAHDPVVGYYRIREGNSLELTVDEISLAVTLFARPGSVVLLVERRAGCPEANFFFLEHGAFLNLPLLEFPLDAAALTEREAQCATRTDKEPFVAASPGLPPPSSGPSSLPAAANGEPASARRPAPLWTFAIVVFVAVASFSAALYIYRPQNRINNAGAARSTLPGARTSLRAERQGEDLKIAWDHNSPAVAGATSGVLDIDDGGATRQIPMTADQVRFGSLLYSPVSEQVSVRLTTLQGNQSTEQESVLVLLRKPQQPQSASGQQIAHIPFEVKTVRVAPTRAFVPPAGNRQIKPPVQPEDLPAIPTRPERVDLPVPPPLGSASSLPGIVVSGNEPAKSATEASWERIDLLASAPLGSASPPAAFAVPRSEPAKPAIQASPARVDLPAPAPLGSTSPPPASAAPQSESAKPREEGYVAPVLIAQEGVQTPRELLPILTRPVAVSVRVDVNAAGRVTRAEAIAEKGIHALLLSAATDAARRCRFQPARRGQSPVSSTVTIVFHIGPEKE